VTVYCKFVIYYIIGSADLKRKILTSKICRKLDQISLSFQSITVESDIVEIVTECKVIQFSANKDLLSII
jgi:hypothetical protein